MDVIGTSDTLEFLLVEDPPRDGTHRCRQCRTDLNRKDLNCWRCGSDRIEEVTT
jgi:hypothetical protein